MWCAARVHRLWPAAPKSTTKPKEENWSCTPAKAQHHAKIHGLSILRNFKVQNANFNKLLQLKSFIDRKLRFINFNKTCLWWFHKMKFVLLKHACPPAERPWILCQGKSCFEVPAPGLSPWIGQMRYLEANKLSAISKTSNRVSSL